MRSLAAVALLLVLAACTGDAHRPESGGSPSPTTTAPVPTPAATAPPPPPERGACYRLAYDDAVSPTSGRDPVPCRGRHTTVTFHVGRLDLVVDGRLLTVDSGQAKRQLATTCPRRFAGFVGGTAEQRRLSMLRSVWFTPTLEASDAGATWFRCDALALAGDGELLSPAGALAGALDTASGRRRYGICGTAEPGTRRHRRVVCARQHAWRAIRTVPLEGGAHPGAAAARRAGQEPCRAAAEAVASDPLDFRWGYEWPTAEQWRRGQTWGLCWVPD